MWDIAGDPERRAARARRGRLQGDPDRGAARSTAQPPTARPPRYLDFLVDLFNRTVEGLEDVEIWIHTCWGNPGAQHCFDPQMSYERVDRHLPEPAEGRRLDDRVEGERPAGCCPRSRPTRDNLPKKVAVGYHQPPPPAGRDARGGRQPTIRTRARAASTPSSCSRPTAASAGRAYRDRSRSTRRRRSRRGRTSCAASSAWSRPPCAPPTRSSRST